MLALHLAYEFSRHGRFLLAAQAEQSHSTPMLNSFVFLVFVLTAIALPVYSQTGPPGQNRQAAIHKLKDILIYQDEQFYSSFPSILRRPDGELLVAFRRAPDRRRFGEKGYTHTDPNSYLMLIRSRDEGKTWTKEPELIYANPFGGSQDPCMVQLRDSTIVCSSYGWALINPKAAPDAQGLFRYGNFSLLGGYLLRSKDGGHTWERPVIPPPTPGEQVKDIFGKPVPAYNRGAWCEGKDGRLYWVVASNVSTSPRRTETHLLISSDKGLTWNYSCPVATDPKITFSETSIYETPKGDLVAFMRTADFDDHTAIARSADHGKSFAHWEDAGFQGHPHHALPLSDKRVLLVYGYRHQPFGVRARILDSECTNAASAFETVLRDDGGNADLGYPWATLLTNDRVLVVYYFNSNDGTRCIAGTLLALRK